MANTIKVKTDQMKKLAELHRLSESAVAGRIGVSRQTYRRALEGENVSAGFVAGAALGFGVPFDTLFYVTSGAETEPAPGKAVA